MKKFVLTFTILFGSGGSWAQYSCKYSLLPNVESNNGKIAQFDVGKLDSQLRYCSIYLEDVYLKDPNTGCEPEKWSMICRYCKDVANQVTIRKNQNDRGVTGAMIALIGPLLDKIVRMQACQDLISEPIIPGQPQRGVASDHVSKSLNKKP